MMMGPGHREIRRTALLAAARHDLLNGGAAAVTLARVGSATGLARSSVYEYFGSAGDLLTEVAVLAFGEWAADVRAAVDDADPGWPQLQAYVSRTLMMVSEGRHDIAAALDKVDFTAAQRERFRDLHVDLTEPLLRSLVYLDVPSPETYAALIQGMIDGATRQVGHGADAAQLSAVTCELIINGLPTVHVP
ncbi:TetR/AcrR family transcriptional regulator [Paenarthrobacter sp. PH39-S1]|uniref:TetR/AcrR family transcriptional regulator n=1 Tax=Paenarthrobacter sp. PH39-S1 TaxID=3046204 RepID=UPI0024BBA140|nr:TetR/AcrR family transcriptional regulator [Paenarthrobacter sp. PH39-S1]MDJ0355733.1 TetR/AcrR family transcriptional regulator [Paenarthrobacter sp. PH39-S1]